jgi:hypothetical protein
MSKRLLVVLPFAFSLLVACGSSPSNLACATTKQSVAYSVLGSCSGASSSKITISTQPSLCSLVVANGVQSGLPATGQFTGDANEAGADGFDLTKGNWTLDVNEGNAADGSITTRCTPTLGAAGTIELSCSSEVCQPSDCTGGSCSFSSCTEHLTPD